ncbi:MAG: helix-turn-helix transcriptional regulator, partial [Firmicutes bacterium]|nr:helix-turn-helix transcriptional regulator [Bacillota bacterium]
DIPKSTFSKRRREFCEFGILDQENGITEFGKSLLFIYDSVDIYLKENGFKPSENRAEFLNLIFAPKWKGRVIWYIYMIPSARFNEMCRNIEGISHKVLNDILIELEMHKVIKKTERDGNMPKTEYELTPLGNEIAKFVVEIGVCCKRHNVITQKVTISVE